jgi:UDP-GlcNAc:undecaprenyl-phosphate GlcNAc-1-phosphate transferase
MNYLFAFLSALALSLILMPIIRRIAHKAGYVVQPDQLRWHKNTTPVLGGVGIYVAFLIPLLFFVKIDRTIAGLLIGTSVIFLVGLFDDIFQISPQLKLIGQIVSACVILAFGITLEVIPLAWIVLPLTIFWIVGITNAFNLLDNMDGLSSGIAFICCAFLFVYSLLTGIETVAYLCIILAGAALGFLRYNFYPAKIFMGDCGSQFLGMAISVIAIIGTGRHISNLLVTLAIPVLILSVPIFDTTFVTLVRRFRGQPISRGGKDHTSHRLVLLGLSERKTVLLLYVLSILFGLIGLLYARVDIIIVSILAVLAVIVLFLFGVFLGERKTYSSQELERLRKNQTKGKAVLNAMLLHKRRIAEVIIDFILICVSYYTAHLLRFEGDIAANFPLMMKSLPWLIVARLGCFYYFGLYQGIWRYISIKDLVAIFKAVTVSTILTIMFLTFFFRFQEYSRVVFMIDGILMLFLASGTRILIRVMRESFASLRPGEKKVLIFGAGDAGEMVLREIRHNKQLNYHAVGFLDDNPKKVGRRIHGVAVLGTREKLTQLVEHKNIEEVIMAIPSAKQEVLDEFFQQCQDCGVKYRRMRGISWE